MQSSLDPVDYVSTGWWKELGKGKSFRPSWWALNQVWTITHEHVSWCFCEQRNNSGLYEKASKIGDGWAYASTVRPITWQNQSFLLKSTCWSIFVSPSSSETTGSCHHTYCYPQRGEIAMRTTGILKNRSRPTCQFSHKARKCKPSVSTCKGELSLADHDVTAGKHSCRHLAITWVPFHYTTQECLWEIYGPFSLYKVLLTCRKVIRKTRLSSIADQMALSSNFNVLKTISDSDEWRITNRMYPVNPDFQNNILPDGRKRSRSKETTGPWSVFIRIPMMSYACCVASISEQAELNQEAWQKQISTSWRTEETLPWMEK